jgi:redox-sensitive bicupin YhaK (pirin superfamily)
MATSRTVTVGTTPTLVEVRADPASTQGWGMEVTVPSGGVTVYAGGSDVTTTGTNVGRAIAAGSSFAFDLSPGERVYLIVATGTQAVTIFATGV